MHVLPPALAPLGAYRQFILYRLVPKGGKVLKLPVDPRTLRVSEKGSGGAHDPAAWVDFQTAATILSSLGPSHGIGFVFTASDPFWFLDIDGAYQDPVLDEDGLTVLQPAGWSQAALDACHALAGAAVEVSQSGRGLHIFGTGVVPKHGCDNDKLHMQFYTEKRFVALTGTNTVGDASYAPPGLAAYIETNFPPPTSAALGGDDWWSDEPVAEWRGPVDDDLLIARALKSRSAASTFGGKACFADLWDADADVLAQHFPPDANNPREAYNPSVADAALAQHLCFWTGNDAARIERLMRRSALMRDKWDDREDYLPRTIRKACSMQTEFLADAPPSTSPFAEAVRAAPVLTGAVRVEENTLLSPDEQVSFFAGCVYVVDEDKFMLPSGMLVDATRFNRVFGGRSFVMDNANGRVIRKAAEAFTESQAYRFPRVDSACFRPRAAPGTIVIEGGRSKVNTWVPINVPRAKGDTSRFWTHLAKMLPVEEDQRIVAYYLAACVQMQGIKFQWAPLIQGTTGNGKSMLSQFVRKAIGKEYCHTPRAKNIDNDFNAWMAGRTFYSVDEIYIPDKRLNILETLKEMITSDEQEVTKKGIDSLTSDICGNFAFFTNHKDGIKKNRHERRIAPFYTAQQSPEDLIRDGLTEEYFRDFVDWLKAHGAYEGQPTGYSIIADMLWTIEIPAKYDPSRMPRAPRTSSTDEAIVASRGPIEQEIVEAVEQGLPGFRGGFVSSLALKKLLADNGHRVPLSMQSEFLAGLGYKPHAALKDGRVNNEVAPDMGKPRLFVLQGSPAAAIEAPAEVARAYVAAQLGK